MIISYDPQYKNRILDSFGLETKDNLIIDKSTGNPVKDNLDGVVSKKKFGGVRKGSLEFINKDVSSLLKLREKLKQAD